MNQVTTEAFTQAARDAAALGRGNLEAVAQSVHAYFQGTQELSRQVLALAQELNGQALDGAKALAGAKSLREAAEIQASFARTTFGQAANEAARLQQAALQVTERVVAPLTRHATSALAQAPRPPAA